MKSRLYAIALTLFISQAALAANPIAGIDPLLYSESGWQWGAFGEPVSVIEFTNSSIILDIGVADDDGEFPGTASGGIGVNTGSDRFGNLDFDHTEYQIEMPFRVLEDNDAGLFRIAVADSDGPDGARDEYYYHVDTFEYEVGEWSTFVRPLEEFDAVWNNNSDGEFNLGNSTIQLMTMWESTDPLNIEFGGVFITEIDPTPATSAFELNANNFGQAWTWGAYDQDGAVSYTEDSIIINAESQDDAVGAQGGLGFGLLEHEFDGEMSELVINARLLGSNEAASFQIELRDDDEDLIGSIVDGVEELEWAAEQYIYDIPTDSFEEGEFSELRIPMIDYASRAQAGGDVTFDGDGELNFGLYMIQIMSPAGPLETLNIEIESIRIDEGGPAPLPGDYNLNGELDAGDLDLQAQVINGEFDAKFDLNSDGVVDVKDRVDWVEDLKQTWMGDSNFDGEFNSSDFVDVFQTGEYEDNVPANSTWATGDWNGDQDFTSSDFVAAFQNGGYEAGPRPATAAVPEPASITLLLFSLVSILGLRRA